MRPMMILVTGNCRSETGDDDRLTAMRAVGWPLFQRGHLTIVGEDLARPLAEVAGSAGTGDAIFDTVFHALVVQLLTRCDAVLRIDGESARADWTERVARWEGKPVFYRVDDIPPAGGLAIPGSLSPPRHERRGTPAHDAPTHDGGEEHAGNELRGAPW